VYEALFQKGLERSVDRHAIELFSCLFFNVAMGQGAILLQKQLEDPSTPAGYAQLIFLKYLVYFLFHMIIPGCC
jgi:hypothetical protein